MNPDDNKGTKMPKLDKSTRKSPIATLGRPVCFYEGDEPRFAIITGPGQAERHYAATVFRPDGTIMSTQIGPDDCEGFTYDDEPAAPPPDESASASQTLREKDARIAELQAQLDLAHAARNTGSASASQTLREKDARIAELQAQLDLAHAARNTGLPPIGSRID